MKDIVQSGKRLWQDLGTRRWIVLLFVGILLAVVAVPTGKDQKDDSQQKNITEDISGDEIMGDKVTAVVSRYEAELEHRLEALLQQIEGAGAVRVMVTVSQSSELILQTDASWEENVVRETDSQGGTRDNVDRRQESQTVLVGGGGMSQPYVVGEIMPRIEGVVVACEGGDRPVIQAEISAAVQALFDLPPHKIKVCKMASP